ncbi:ABC transporter substrate-binding protein [Paenibacillus sp. CF384]|uniref:ABC transporter substrate-binding protein n=1 Tax=Paenibacillus sp. CF384 TaxID=1884382 RepID=UPI0008976DDC|nr:extracellular solute-binding protein [Paenibacillus sp. CF384]SDX79972.1 ABC-type glycerol-3-phosphate transport system, substrate-binding protein [Paenibacillus sp. CF384]
MDIRKGLFSSIAAMLLLSSCQEEDRLLRSADQKTTLEIAYFSEANFKEKYRDLLDREFPNLHYTIESYSDVVKGKISAEEWLNKHPDIDVIFVPGQQINEYIDHGLLRDMDSIATNDHYDLSLFVPSAIEFVRAYGNGKLYGIPSNFNSKAILYNKQLFDLNHVAVPTGNETWQDVLEKSIHFVSENQPTIKGLQIDSPTPYFLLRDMGWSKGLSMYQSDNVSLNSKGWESVWNTASEALKSGSIVFEQEPTVDEFVRGERAMILASYEEYTHIVQQNPAFEWNAVPIPSEEDKPGTTRHFTVDGIYAIANQTHDEDAAWELIKFLNSEKTMRWTSQNNHGFPALLSQIDQERAAAYYHSSALLPYNDYLSISVYNLVNQTLGQIVDNKLDVQAALEELQSKAAIQFAEEQAGTS